MQAAAYPYQPVRERGTLTCFLLALLMHLLLGSLLYYGVRWRSAAPEGVAAELWEPIPEAATPEPATRPVPTPKPVEVEDADISLQEKQRKAELAAREDAQARQRENQARAEAARKEAQRKAAETQQRQADNAQRQSELARLRAQAGGTGAAASAGTGSGSSAKPSSGYAERVRQRVKPNIIFNEDVPGNPAAVVAVLMAPDGSVLSTRLARSSGNTGWDNAVLRAVQRSDPLPRDTNGVAPSNILITFWPKDEGS